MLWFGGYLLDLPAQTVIHTEGEEDIQSAQGRTLSDRISQYRLSDAPAVCQPGASVALDRTAGCCSAGELALSLIF